MDSISPALDQRLEFVYYNHPKPWRLSCGEMGEPQLKDGRIVALFSLTKKDAWGNKRWDPVAEHVVLEVIDANNCAIFEVCVKVDKSIVQGRLGLK